LKCAALLCQAWVCGSRIRIRAILEAGRREAGLVSNGIRFHRRPDLDLVVEKDNRIIELTTFRAFAMPPLSLAGAAGARIWPMAIGHACLNS
jgi:hypothetical protein